MAAHQRRAARGERGLPRRAAGRARTHVSRFAKAAIVGTGAVGGSIGGGLRVRGLADEVAGFDPANAQAAREAGWIDRVASSLQDAVRGADLVVLAAPVPVNRALLGDPALREALGARAVLTDVSSTK
ncbi:MAG TPA: prephenate dehydrogenase/arogenate dehydrogenase family protein, partial [Burkholderiaceae bacterium]|nr:prephenate dehydrogenase/arogenate dehydrogenase family protein [Burkholderiaceae bacterium]